MDLFIFILAVFCIILYIIIKKAIKIGKELDRIDEQRKKEERSNYLYKKQLEEFEKDKIKEKTDEILKNIEIEEHTSTYYQQQNNFYKNPPNFSNDKTTNNNSKQNSKAKKINQSAKRQYTDYRKTHPAEYRCMDGHYVRSKAEREIDNFFFYNDIKHIYEFEYHNSQRNKTYFTDFYLPKYNLYIEYFGRTNPEYLKKKSEKIAVYLSDISINFEYLDNNDDHNLEGKLNHICQKYNISIK